MLPCLLISIEVKNMTAKNEKKLTIKGTHTVGIYGFTKKYGTINMAGQTIGMHGHSNSVKMVIVNGKRVLPPLPN